jgi:hypothetical protein
MSTTTKSRSRARTTKHQSTGFALRGFETHVSELAMPHDAILAMVEAFVEDRGPTDPEGTSAVLLCALDLVYGRRSFLEGDWILLATTHVYCHFWGKGFGALRTLTLLEGFVLWLHRRGEVHAWDVERFLGMIDDQRWAAGGKRRRPEGTVERGMAFDDVSACVDEYLADIEHPGVEHSLIRASIDLVAVHASEDGFVRFGAFDAVDFTADLCEADAETGLIEPAARKALFIVAASFYRWLGRSGKLRADRAEILSSDLGRFALVF